MSHTRGKIRSLFVLFFLVAFSSSGFAVFSQNTTETETSPQEQTEAEAKQSQKTQEEEFSRYFQEEFDSDPTESLQPKKRVSWLWQFIKTVFGLSLVIGFFYALVRLFRFQQKLPARYSEVVKNHHQYPVATGKQIQILEVGKRLLVVAVSDAGIQLLVEITEKSEMDLIKLQSQQSQDIARPDFLTELINSMKGEWQKTKTTLAKKEEREQQATTHEEEIISWDNMRKASQEKLERLKTNREQMYKEESDS